MAKCANNYYNKIAKIYDLIYTKETGFDHEAQVKWVDDWRKKLNLPKKVLDLACGTGIHLNFFKNLKYEYQGIDASQGMLDIAKKRLKGVPLKKGFFENFKLKDKIPIITSYFNAMNHNTNFQKLKSTFKNIYSNLSDDGIFVFDTFCIEKSAGVFVIKKFENEKLKISRTIVGLPTLNGIKSTIYYVIFDGINSEIISETFFRGVFSKEHIIGTLESVGFKVLYNGSGYAQGHNIFVAQRQA